MKKLTSTLTMAFLCLYVSAQVGSLDIQFNASGTNGIGPGFRIDNPSGLPDVYDFGTAMAFTSDGKILVAGYTQNDDYFLVVRYTKAGILDNSFGTGGVVRVRSEDGPGGNSARGYGMALQPDGKIVVAGWNWPTNKDFCVMRFNEDGSFDNSFGTDGKVTTNLGPGNDEARNVAIQNDGKIVVTGFSFNASGNSDYAVVRYKPDGSLDGSFGSGGIVKTNINSYDIAQGISINNTTGAITIAGTSNSSFENTHTGNGDFTVVRYTSSGALDGNFGSGGIATFDIGTGTYDEARGMAVQPDGQLLVAGITKPGGARGANSDVVVLRIATDGSLDGTFGSGGKAIANYTGLNSDDDCNSVALQSDGKIVIGGSVDIFPTSNGDKKLGLMTMRFTAAGQLDVTFDGDGKAAANIALTDDDRALVVALNGDRIYLAGTSGGPPDLAIAAFQNDNSTLPMILTQFYGQKQTSSVVLQWTTSMEENVSQFVVERSNDGKTFKAIGTVAATGNSFTARNYSFADQSPFTTADNYYRLRVQDLDGSVTFSKILIIKYAAGSTSNLQIFPNPVKNVLQVQIPGGFNGNTSLQVFDLNGQLVKRSILTSNGNALNTTLDISTLPVGVYTLKATDGHISINTRFVKQ
ncbi:MULTISPECIES: T9SS type A sorting domain-containing protein [Niastella]|uniref:T9SS type A sorting domain-containing protein n=1 Tax=Niastella soli TaxID=2821487 RepID=A0ABS3Z0I8_9BACT|nr:T9SS type A sorting domain-containing protein [Niastella soli]MBO9203686.1 T9SS type A sorting domain-containing protein [Niastella soli]